MKAAIYARYSTENQREASVEDQIRECNRIADQNGFEVLATFTDKGMSGGTTERPGYQALLAGARAKMFGIIVAEDSSRLWRNMAEQAPRLAELSDLGVHVVAHDLDTRLESAELLGAVSGAMNSLYRKEISRRTRRGLEGKALAGESTGRRVYGYRSFRDIDPAQAAIVLRIFERYAAGASSRCIAAELNAEGIRAPQGGVWRGTTLIALLRNPRYTGAVIWGRRYIRRSAADSARSTAVERPGGPLVSHPDGAPRIVPDGLWQAVRARFERACKAA